MNLTRLSGSLVASEVAPQGQGQQYLQAQGTGFPRCPALPRTLDRGTPRESRTPRRAEASTSQEAYHRKRGGFALTVPHSKAEMEGPSTQDRLLCRTQHKMKMQSSLFKNKGKGSNII